MDGPDLFPRSADWLDTSGRALRGPPGCVPPLWRGQPPATRRLSGSGLVSEPGGLGRVADDVELVVSREYEPRQALLVLDKNTVAGIGLPDLQ